MCDTRAVAKSALTRGSTCRRAPGWSPRTCKPIPISRSPMRSAKTADPFDDLIGDRLIGIGLHVLGDQPGARRHVEPPGRAAFGTPRRPHILPYQTAQRGVTHC